MTRLLIILACWISTPAEHHERHHEPTLGPCKYSLQHPGPCPRQPIEGTR